MTKPVFVILAILLLLDTQVPFVEGVTFAVKPTQTKEGPLMTGAPGTAFMAAVLDEPDVHPFVFETVNV